jgi:hypothetical protein
MSQSTNTQNNDEFINNLVMAITGNEISEFEPSYQITLAQECLNAFISFITEFVTAKYSEIDAIRLKSSLQFSGDAFAKFSDLGEKFDDAYNAFLESLTLANS